MVWVKPSSLWLFFLLWQSCMWRNSSYILYKVRNGTKPGTLDKYCFVCTLYKICKLIKRYWISVEPIDCYILSPIRPRRGWTLLALLQLWLFKTTWISLRCNLFPVAECSWCYTFCLKYIIILVISSWAYIVALFEILIV